MESELLEEFDRHVAREGYPNRSEALRELIRAALVRDAWLDDTAQVIGALNLVYDHHQSDAVNQLLQVQHDAGGDIICTTHVHLNHDQCLELLLVRGTAGALRRLAKRLRGIRGVAHGELTMTPVAGDPHHPHGNESPRFRTPGL